MKKRKVGKKDLANTSSLREKITLLEEQLKRAVADYCNLESRISKETWLFKREVLARLVDKLLAVFDDLERAEKNLNNKGLTIAVRQFKQVLVSEKVEEIKTDGAKFDPEKMDCVAMVKGPKNRVAKTVLKGYTLNGGTIRPAKVKVGRG